MTFLDPIDPSKMMGDGNTNSSPTPKKQAAPALRYCFTFNNYTDPDILILTEKFRSICKKYVFQEEVGELGTPHLQGSIWLLKKARPETFKLSKSIHWEKMRNESASIEYCQKSSTSVSAPHIWGFPKPIKIIEVLYKWQQDNEDLFFTETTDRGKINWYWEPIGNRGKSSFCKYMVVKHKALVIQGGKLTDIMNMIFNTDMDQCTMVIIDIPRINQNKVSYASIECILNGMITNTKYETGTKVFNPPHVVVFSNFPPEQGIGFMSEDRWNIVEVI